MSFEEQRFPVNMVNPYTGRQEGAVARPATDEATRIYLQVVDGAHGKAETDAWLSFLAASDELPASRVVYVALLKRVFDVAGAALLLVILGLPLLLIMAALRLEGKGSVIFRQERIGKDGRPFTVYKFGTMIPDRRGTQIPYVGGERRVSHKTPDDPRVTAVGRLLRRTSLDELPQIVNVLKGEMSFIGPRPELPKIVARYEPWQHERHLVRPGLSGWWQVEGRSDRPMHENTELDIYYIRNCSFVLDLKIFARTFGALLKRRGAF